MKTKPKLKHASVTVMDSDNWSLKTSIAVVHDNDILTIKIPIDAVYDSDNCHVVFFRGPNRLLWALVFVKN